MHTGVIRVHHHGDEVHFHDDLARLKVSVPVAHFMQQYQSYIGSPEGDLVFRDWGRMTVVILTYRQEQQGGVADASLGVRLEKIDLGSVTISEIDGAQGVLEAMPIFTRGTCSARAGGDNEAMPDEQAHYEVVDDFVEMCSKFVTEKRDQYSHIDPKMLRMAVITNREPSAGGPIFKIIRVNNPMALFCPFRYVVVTWREIWDEMDAGGRRLLLSDVFECLCANK